MKCFYEVLELENDCSETDIKSAYRRMALKWHPDKNDNSSEAKEQFQQIQHAYSILSNPQERDFYDRNKDQVLYQDSSDDSQDITVCIYTYFPSSCFKGYNDSQTGFFTVYRTAFETIAKKEREFMKTFHEIPSFGRSDTDLKVVADFYDYWLNYSTEMHFAWSNVHRIQREDCREAKKYMERENKKKRAAARKKFTNYVREFVQLVKKRDTRMKAYQLEKQEEFERKKQETLQKQEESRRRRVLRKQELYTQAAETAVVDEAYEETLRKLERSHARDSSYSSPSEDGVASIYSDTSDNFILSTLYCVVCGKLFKTEVAFNDHQNSDRHLEKLEKLQLMMKAQDEVISKNEKSEEVIPETSKPQRKKGRKKDKQLPVTEINQADLMADELNLMGLSNTEEKAVDDNVEITETKKIKKPRRRAKNTAEPLQKPLNSSFTEQNPNQCQVCGKEFPGKNKLFKHIKAEGHAALKR